MYTYQDVIVQRKSADCSLTPEALPPLAAMRTDGQGQRQRDGDNKDRNRDRGTRMGQRGRDSYIQTGTGTEGQRQKAR